MAPAEKSAIVKILEDSRADFHAAVDGVSESHAEVCPAPGREVALPSVFLRFIGVAEMLGAAGLILPGLPRI